MMENEELIFEPRLREYLKKKLYYTKNNMTPCISLEKEYAITYNDIQKMKRYLKNSISPSILNKNSDFYNNKIHNIQPKLRYKQPIHYECIDRTCRELDHNPDSSVMMEYTKDEVEIPAFLSQCISKQKRVGVYDDRSPNDCVNKIQEQYYNNRPMDPEILNDMILGMPIHTKKSYGYDDPFDHYFDYIDGDLQKPEHTVMEFPRGGISARLENTKQRVRKIY